VARLFVTLGTLLKNLFLGYDEQLAAVYAQGGFQIPHYCVN
jgi:hypothetical protein